MNDFLLSHETTIRLSIFFGIFAVVCLAEILFPRKKLTMPKALRWTNNIGLVFFNSILIKVLIPITAAGLASWAAAKGYGLFNITDLPVTLEIILTIIILDLIIYSQHILFHLWKPFWKIHRMHHIDTDYDVTLGSRFHPIEIILSMVIKFFFVILLGAPAAAVILFEVILNGMAMFNHGNFKLPLSLDKVLRLIVVTPDTHRVHHSTHPEETHSNFGFNLSIWDRIFKTYVAQPKEGHEDMIIGLKKFREVDDHKFLGLLKIPFRP